MVKKHQAYLLELAVGEPPMIRLRGELRRVDMPPFCQMDLEALIYPIMDQQQRQCLQESGKVFFAHNIGRDEGGFACTVSQKAGQLRLSACLLESASD